MRTNPTITSALVICIFALVSLSLSCCPEKAAAQNHGSPAYTPPPDQKIYLRPGPRERSIGVTVTNSNVPGLPHNLDYLKQTIETLEDSGYEVPDAPARADIQVRVTAKYTQVDNSKAVTGEVGGRAAAGAVLGALGGLAVGGGGRGAAEGAAGGAVYGAASGATTPPVLRYLTLEFDVSSGRRGSQTGRVTRDITNLDMELEDFIDGTIADYLAGAFPKR